MSRPLLAVSVGAGALVIGAGLGGGPLLMRDAVSTPRSFLTDAALGLGENPARAVPQDALLAAASTVVPGSILVVALTWIALALSGVGAGLLAGRVLIDARWAPQCAAALAAIWNPWVAERMMQGHWSLLAGYAAIPWIFVAAERIWRSDRTGWPLLWVAVFGAGLTPTGSVLAGIVVLATVVMPRATGLRQSALAVLAVVAGALPWLVATVLNSAGILGDPAGAQAFSLRAEPGLGRVLTALGMGGIWNADAVPASRTTWWAAVGTLLLLALVAVGWVVAGRDLGRDSSRGHSSLDCRNGAPECAHPGDRGAGLPSRNAKRILIIAAALALSTVALVVFASTPPGLSAIGWAVDHLPGAGLFRDTQKFLALLLPATVIGVAGSVRGLTRLVPAGFAVALVALLVVAPLPDAALRFHPVNLPADWVAVAQLVPKDQGAVALWPPTMTREYSFASTSSLDPARRLLRAPVLESGALVVDGKTVDADPTRVSAQVELALAEGAGPTERASHGVGWLLVEEPERNGVPAGFGTDRPVFQGEYLALYRIPGPVIAAGASPVRRGAVVGAHVAWVLGLGIALALLGATSRSAGRARARATLDS